MLNYTKELLFEQCDGHVLQTFERRLISILRYKALKIMKSIDLTHMTAEELQNIMKIIIFALNNLYKDYKGWKLVINSYAKFITNFFEYILPPVKNHLLTIHVTNFRYK